MTDNIKFDLKSLKAIAQEFVQDYRQNLIKADAYASGELANETSPLVEQNGGLITVYLSIPHQWVFVENGRKPGKWPPRAAILNWIKQKHILPRGNKPVSQESLAFLIQRKIGTVGIKPRPILQNTLDTSDIYDRLIDEIYTQFDKYLQESIEDTTEN